MRFGWASLAAAALLLAACGGSDGASGEDDPRVAEAAAFMARNADADGVVTLESGLQYKVLTAAPDGAPGPDGNDLVRVMVKADNIFDVTGRRHASFTKDFVPLAGRNFKVSLLASF